MANEIMKQEMKMIKEKLGHEGVIHNIQNITNLKKKFFKDMNIYREIQKAHAHAS
jgi:hypothetical protein